MTFEEWWDIRISTRGAGFASDADDMGLAFEAFSAGRDSMKAEALAAMGGPTTKLDWFSGPDYEAIEALEP